MTTDSLPIFCQYLFDKIWDARTLLGMPDELHTVNVFYGDQDQINFTPTICIEPDSKRRELNGVRRRTQNTLRAGILIYCGQITDPQFNRKRADELAEAVEALIHADATFGPHPDQLLIDSLVESVESGYQRKGNSVLRTSRLIVRGTSQTILPQNP